MNYLVVSTPSCNAIGLGTQSIPFPGGLQGVSFSSQVVALDENTGTMTSAYVTRDPDRRVQSIYGPESVRARLSGGHGL